LSLLREGRTVRTDRWRYTEWLNGAVELYDEEPDPHEYHNLADESRWTATRAELASLLKAGWRAARPK
jgi:hypothetical protein